MEHVSYKNSKISIDPKMPNPVWGEEYNVSLSAQRGKPPYVWKIESGNLPDGLVLNETEGVISGTPSKTGKYDFTISVADSNNNEGKQSFSQVIHVFRPSFLARLLGAKSDMPKTNRPSFLAGLLGVKSDIPKTNASRYSIQLLKLIGVVNLIGSVLTFLFLLKIYPALGIGVMTQGVIVCVFIFVIAGIAEDLIEIRKNTTPKKQNTYKLQ